MILRESEKETDFLRAINRCWLQLKQAARKILANHDYDLTIEQLMVLMVLQEEDGQNIRALAELTDRERTTTTRMIDGLEERNLVVRVPDKGDGRYKLVYLTREGKRITREADKLRRKFEEQAFKGLKKSEILQTAAILQKVSGNFNLIE